MMCFQLRLQLLYKVCMCRAERVLVWVKCVLCVLIQVWVKCVLCPHTSMGEVCAVSYAIVLCSVSVHPRHIASY